MIITDQIFAIIEILLLCLILFLPMLPTGEHNARSEISPPLPQLDSAMKEEANALLTTWQNNSLRPWRMIKYKGYAVALTYNNHHIHANVVRKYDVLAHREFAHGDNDPLDTHGRGVTRAMSWAIETMLRIEKKESES